MRHATIENLKTVAVVTAEPARPLTTAERRSRWADLLAQRGTEPLSTLVGTEYVAPAARARMQTPNSALSVAFADPILRGDGLTGETYGAARDYFHLTDWQLHEIICHCHHGATTSALATSRRVRAIGNHWLPSLVERTRRLFAG